MEIIGLVDDDDDDVDDDDVVVVVVDDLYRRGLRCCECHWGCVRHGWVRTSALLNMLRVDVHVRYMQ